MEDPLGLSVLRHWQDRVASGGMTPGTASRYGRVFESYVRFLHACGTCLREVDGRLCRAFVHAPAVGGDRPAESTSRFRLTVVRDAYHGLIEAGLAVNDPTTGLRIAQGPQQRFRAPLSPTEAARLRAAGRLSPRDHLRPAVVELALCGGSHAEISRVVIADLDLEEATLRLGNRSVALDPFAVSTMRARLAACRRDARRQRMPWDPTTVSVALKRPLASYPATSVAPSISSSLSRAMTSAGLTRPGLRPASIREYAANRCYALEGRVEGVAALLGLASLDVAKGYIDASWQEEFGEEVRAGGSS